MKIGARSVGGDAPAFVLAEVASAHQGNASRALELARSAAGAGADGVKFQLFRASELIPPADARRPTFDQIELTPEEWDGVLAEAGKLSIEVLVEVFDRTSLAIAERHRVAAYKIHSTDLENPELIRAVAHTGKPLLLATGGSSLGAVEEALGVARRGGARELMLLHGVQSFPTRVEDSELAFLATLKRAFGVPVGFLDHVDGGSATALFLPALAVALGADLVEKHVTLDRAAKGFDYESALEPDGFRSMVERVREAEASLGSGVLPGGEAAERYHRLMRRAVMSRVPLSRGEPVSREQVVFLRSETGLAPRDASRILGRKPREDVPAFVPLTEELFD